MCHVARFLLEGNEKVFNNEVHSVFYNLNRILLRLAFYVKGSSLCASFHLCVSVCVHACLHECTVSNLILLLLYPYH